MRSRRALSVDIDLTTHGVSSLPMAAEYTVVAIMKLLIDLNIAPFPPASCSLLPSFKTLTKAKFPGSFNTKTRHPGHPAYATSARRRSSTTSIMKCCVPGCVGDVARSGYPFPSGAVMRYKWHRAIQIRAPPHHGGEGLAAPSFSPAGAKVCGEHFRPDDFEEVDGERVLKMDAVPTVFASEGRAKTGSSLRMMGERVRFRQRTQRPAEAIEAYLHSLQVSIVHMSPMC